MRESRRPPSFQKPWFSNEPGLYKFTINYSSQNLKEVVAKQGALPVIVYANGACFNNNVEMRLLLSEVASYGYLAAAIGPYDEEDVMAQWRGVLKSKDGHSGTYYEKHGGNYAKAVVKWLDWQLKGQVGQSALFLDDEYLKMKFPEWQGVRKNF